MNKLNYIVYFCSSFQLFLLLSLPRPYLFHMLPNHLVLFLFITPSPVTWIPFPFPNPRLSSCCFLLAVPFSKQLNEFHLYLQLLLYAFFRKLKRSREQWWHMTPHDPASTLQANFQVWFIIMMPSLCDLIKQDSESLSSPVPKTDVLVGTKAWTKIPNRCRLILRIVCLFAAAIVLLNHHNSTIPPKRLM